MLKITILCVGTLKEAYWRDALSEYAKRLTPYCTFRVVEVGEERLRENASEAETDAAMQKEAEKLLAKADDKGILIVLAIDGKRFSSEAFSARLAQYAINGASHVQFVIGGSTGLHASILNRADLRMSFSDMTFPHQMMRVILAEQIYRSFKIQNGEPYHK